MVSPRNPARDGSAVVSTTITLDNQAPQDAQPSYQMGPDQFTSRPGDYVGWLRGHDR